MEFLIEDNLCVKEIDMILKNESGKTYKIKKKIYKNVSRIFATSNKKATGIVLDVNTKIFPLSEGDELDFLISLPLNKKNSDTEKFYNYNNLSNIVEKDVMERYDYVMYGSIFHTGEENEKKFFYASFGGLLLKYFGKSDCYIHENFAIDSNILLFLKKI
jgi:hypothetical protein